MLTDGLKISLTYLSRLATSWLPPCCCTAISLLQHNRYCFTLLMLWLLPHVPVLYHRVQARISLVSVWGTAKLASMASDSSSTNHSSVPEHNLLASTPVPLNTIETNV
jgi:hypothetical protein